MVSLLILSHSPKIAEGVRELAQEMAKSANIVAVGGTKAGTLGADFDAALEAITRCTEDGGEVIVLTDIGSTRMTAQMAVESLDGDRADRVHLCDAAMVEGAVVIAIGIGAGFTCDMTLEQVAEYRLKKD